jgi:magnesium transporter
MLFVGGKHVSDTLPTPLTPDTLRATGGFAIIELDSPTPEEMRKVGQELGLHELAVNDTVNAHQRSKLERYGDVVFLVLHTADYDDAAEKVAFGEIHLFVAPTFVVAIQRGASRDLAVARSRIEASPDLLHQGPYAVLYEVFDAVVDGYRPVILGLENDITEIEDQLFSQNTSVSQRIYELAREVISFQRAARPTVAMAEELQRAGSGAVWISPSRSLRTRAADRNEAELEFGRRMRDVHDHTVAVAERADEFRQMLENALQVHATLVAQQQNEEMAKISDLSLKQGEAAKKISSWAAIFLAPTLIAGIYGMNFNEMPELHWALGYPFALSLMGVAAFTLYRTFKKVDWL